MTKSQVPTLEEIVQKLDRVYDLQSEYKMKLIRAASDDEGGEVRREILSLAEQANKLRDEYSTLYAALRAKEEEFNKARRRLEKFR